MLTERKKRFVEVYDLTGNATEAAKKAGYSEATAHSQGPRLLEDVDVKKALSEKRKERTERVELQLNEVLTELKGILFFDARKLFNTDGSPKQINELDDMTVKAIAGLEVLEQYEGSGQERKFVGYVKKYKIADKNSAIDKAMRHLGAYLDKSETEHKGKIEVTVRRIGSQKPK